MGDSGMTEEQVRKGKFYLDEIEALRNEKLNWEQCTKYHDGTISAWCEAGSCKLKISSIPFPDLKDMIIKMLDYEINTLKKELEAL